MKGYKNYLPTMTIFVVLSFFLLTITMTQNILATEAPSPDSNPSVSAGDSAKPEELAQILAPIALYPDALLAQMLMAATYPLEVVEAERFAKENSNLKEDALDKALKEKEWDVSVKSLCHFPAVLGTMSEHLDATKRLGDYFLDDQKAVMDMVQTLRTKAHEEGNLKTTKEQKVVVEEKIIIIESVNPEVIYVPSYSCTYVYGSWWYPYYPPYVWYPPPPRYGFAVGIIVGVGISHWCHPRWRHGDIKVNINRTNNFNRNGNIGGGGRGEAWKHNPKHRQGVAYNNKGSREKFGQSDRTAKQRDISRANSAQGLNKNTRDSTKKQGLNSNNNVGQADKRKQRQNASAPTPSNRQGASQRQPSVNRSQPQNSNAFKSSGSGQRTNQASQRGNISQNRGARGGRRR